jgi:hypothetical protein
VVPFRVLSRRVSSYLSRRSTLNCRFFNDLQPLESLFTVPVLCFQWLAASFSKTPGVGYTHDPRPFGISNIQALSLRPICNLATLSPSASAIISEFRSLFVFITLRIPFPTAPPATPLYFHGLTNPLASNPFPFTSIQNPRGVTLGTCRYLGLPAFRFLPIQFFRPASAQVGNGATRPLCGFPIHSGEVS